MKFFLKKSVLFLIIIIGTLVGVNYYGDAANIFDQDYEKKIAEILQSGKYVTNISNYDERLLQKIQISKLDSAATVVVLGSSRTMLIGKGIFDEKNIRNSSVSGAYLHDVIGIYQLYKENEAMPKKILIGIDPWIFNENAGQEKWRTLKIEYCSFLGKICKNNTKEIKFQQIISPSYFQSSWENIWKLNSQPEATLKRYNETNTKLNDGSLIYNKAMRDISNKEIHNSIDSFLNGDIYRLNNFKHLSPKYIKEFKLLVFDMLCAGIEVEFVLIPYAPKVYEVIVKEYNNVIEVENFVRTYAKKFQINFYGSYDPHKFNLKNIDFYDGMHLKPEGVKKILN